MTSNVRKVKADDMLVDWLAVTQRKPTGLLQSGVEGGSEPRSVHHLIDPQYSLFRHYGFAFFIMISWSVRLMSSTVLDA
jgi:hypothetical protein